MLLLTRQRIRFEWGMLLRLSAPGVKAAFAAGIGALPALLVFSKAHWSLHFLLGIAGMGGAVLALAWFHPASFRVGPYDLLAQIAGRVPLAALRNRWAPEENR